jgi:hypothetical protein
LNWEDKQWLQRGCPSSLIGTWVSGDNNFSDLKTLTVQDNLISITSSNKGKQNYMYSGNITPGPNRFVELRLESADKNAFYYKVRPHKVSLSKGHNEINLKSSDCFIKIFEYVSKKKAKLDRYVDWDIYILKKN